MLENMMTGSSHIFEKEETYKRQMLAVREAVLCFAESKGWSPQSRGRRAHVSIYGSVNGLSGVMDIEMTEVDWNRMPTSLQPDTLFTLWSSAFLDRHGTRYVADTELFWTVPFASLPATVSRFMAEAWEMLTGLNESNLIGEFPGPSQNPDGPPDFGPPRRRGNQA
jgi:hypothetical protein